jgi:hypothetical protein
MGGLVPGLDERVEGLMTAVRLDTEEQLSGWLATVRAACPADQPDPSVNDFATALQKAPALVQQQVVRTSRG